MDAGMPSLKELAGWLFLYGLANYRIHQVLGRPPRKEQAKEGKAPAHKRAKKKRRRVRGHLPKPSEQGHSGRRSYYQRYSEDQHPTHCPS